MSYVGNHDILDFNVCMNDVVSVKVTESKEKLSNNFKDFFFFEYFEPLFEGVQGIFCEFHKQVYMGFRVVDMV